MTNRQVASKLRDVAIAYEILGENRFRINAYNQAAESIENLTSDINQVWKQGELQQIPGVGGSLSQHLDELFSTGNVKHFDKFTEKMPKGMYDLLKIRTVGPKTAYKLAKLLNESAYDQNKSIYDRLEQAINDKTIQDLEGFGEKRETELYDALKQYRRGIKKKKRMLLSDADIAAYRLEKYMKKDANLVQIDFLGSFRRRKETVGDLDISISSEDPEGSIEHFVNYPEMEKIVDQGEKGATILLKDGIQVDLRVISKAQYGSMLQYFTGSKYHNIALREQALKKGLSLSEWGIKEKKSGKLYKFSDEKRFYQHIGLEWIEPELREERGEVDLASRRKLPSLIDLSDIKGDMHIHTDYDYPSSHDQGASSIESILKKAYDKKYEYVGFADHNPKQRGSSEKEIIEITKERTSSIEHLLYRKKLVQKYNSIKKVYIMYEVDIRPDGEIALPKKALNYLDGIIISIHSSFNQTISETTNRLLKTMYNPKVIAIAHPTGRLINEREPVKADWKQIFTECKKRNIALEINSSPNRLDLSDMHIFEAVNLGCKLIINTDAHHIDHMDNIRYGVSNARRGWATKDDILNSYSFNKFDEWFSRR